MKKRIDLTGRQFSDLMVISKADSKEKGRFWNARCTCGKEMVVKQSDLKNQRITSCGHEENKATVVAAPKAKVEKKKATPASGSTGYVGVKQVELKSGTRYKANISVQGKNKHLGTFDTLEEAIAVRKEAEALYR